MRIPASQVRLVGGRTTIKAVYTERRTRKVLTGRGSGEEQQAQAQAVRAQPVVLRATGVAPAKQDRSVLEAFLDWTRGSEAWVDPWSEDKAKGAEANASPLQALVEPRTPGISTEVVAVDAPEQPPVAAAAVAQNIVVGAASGDFLWQDQEEVIVHTKGVVRTAEGLELQFESVLERTNSMSIASVTGAMVSAMAQVGQSAAQLSQDPSNTDVQQQAALTQASRNVAEQYARLSEESLASGGAVRAASALDRFEHLANSTTGAAAEQSEIRRIVDQTRGEAQSTRASLEREQERSLSEKGVAQSTEREETRGEEVTESGDVRSVYQSTTRKGVGRTRPQSG